MQSRILYYVPRCSAIVLIGLLIYGQVFGFDFVFDDHIFIVTNPYIKDLNNFHLIWHSFPLTRLVGMYSFALNYYFNKLSPQGYHIFNFIVHLAATGLVWALAELLFKITKELPSKDKIIKELPFIIAVLFLIHPCQTQAVTYVTQRFESMATVFYLGTAYLYLRARLSTKKIHQVLLFGLAGSCTILGIMTKEVVITVPGTILAAEWIFFPKKDNKRIFIILIIAGTLLYVLFTKLLRADMGVFLQTFPSLSHDGDVLTPMHYFLTQMRVFLTFLRLLIFPIHQNFDYDYPVSIGLLDPPMTLLGISVILGSIFLTIKLRRNFPLIAFGLAWVLVTFSINLAPRSNLIFEHKLYLISFGFFLVLVKALSVLIHDRKILLRSLSCMIAVLTILSFQRNKIWKNDLTLWNNAVQESPHKARPYANRAFAYLGQGNVDQAVADLNKAIEINPSYVDAYNNRGLVYYYQGNLTLAIADFSKAVQIKPDDADAYANRGLAYYGQEKLAEAIADYNRAIALNPKDAAAYYDRGLSHAKQNDLKGAIADFTQAIEINPNYTKAYKNRAACYHQLNEK